MTACHGRGGNQEWELSNGGQLKHVKTGLCLDGGEGVAGSEVVLDKCGGGKSQVWVFDFYKEGREGMRPAL